MDPLNILKIIAAIITIVMAMTVGIIELRLNPENLLNKWFFLFFMSGSLGFLAYTTYHIILFNSDLVIPIMITAHIFFNFIPVSLVMTVFILEKYKKIAMSFKYLGTMIILFIIMSFGYFIPYFKPSLDIMKYSDGIVDTTTPLGWFIFVNVIRIALSAFVVYKYAKITRTIGEETKKRVQWFFSGILLVIIALFINLVGGMLEWIPLEIIALFTINIGSLLILKGFLL
ncbi:MAG: hypothetical protein ACFE8B_05065 [Candidatus Hermodarchaeota archaeon]